jgi:pyridoxal phosphate enzyme (YggS family)
VPASSSASVGLRAQRPRPRGGDLVAVGKTVPADRLRAAVAAGLTTLGENRVQEAAAKIPVVAGARWHLVGPLQANKARRAVELFDTIEALDGEALALRLDRLVREVRGLPADGPVDDERRLPILLEVNVDRDPAKAGIEPEALPRILSALRRLEALRVDGLMTIGRLVDEPEAARPTFIALRDLSDALRREHPTLGPALSMGMTDDFEVAVEEGATIVRVGRALFGERSVVGAPPPDEAPGPSEPPRPAERPGR